LEEFLIFVLACNYEKNDAKAPFSSIITVVGTGVVYKFQLMLHKLQLGINWWKC